MRYCTSCSYLLYHWHCHSHYYSHTLLLQVYQRITPTKREVMLVDKSASPQRPFCVCAVLRNVTFDANRYKSFIDLQDKLHQNICRRRTYVAIGTHDLDTIQGPFKYRNLPPSDINFVPLTENNNKSFNSKDLLDHYRTDPSCKHLKPYTDIIYDSDVYPVITDANDTVLSLPPIINGKHSRIQLHTKNVFIECTATDLTKANIVLDTVVTMFSEHCAAPFTVEEVEVVYEVPPPAQQFADSSEVSPAALSTLGLTKGDPKATVAQITPLLSKRPCDAALSEINGIIGVQLEPDEICRLCNKMQLGPAEFLPETGVVRVQVPPTRSDVLHAVDVIEDVAIAYGYNNLEMMVPKTNTVGGPLPINQFTDLLRAEIARAGYMEMLTHGLCSTAENFTNLKREIGPAVSLSNPANIEYEVVRTTLLPGALKTLAHNKSISHKEGVKLFEISDVVVPEDNEVGAKNIRKLVGLHAAHSSAFEVVHGLVDRVMRCAQIVPLASYATTSMTAADFTGVKKISRPDVLYFLKPSDDPVYFTGMGADIVLQSIGEDGVKKDVVIGNVGVVHPDVLANFEVTYPCCVMEMDLEAIM
jgi:phenylalanyl-tRNA synthetase beta chain